MVFLPFDEEQLIHFSGQYVHMLDILIAVQYWQHEILNRKNDDFEQLLRWTFPINLNSKYTYSAIESTMKRSIRFFLLQLEIVTEHRQKVLSMNQHWIAEHIIFNHLILLPISIITFFDFFGTRFRLTC